MRLLLLTLLLGAALRPAWGTDGAARAEKNAKGPVERLKEIEREVRSRSDEADEEVKRMREEAKRITREGEEKAAKIRAEAEEYTKKIQREIEEIKKSGPQGWAESTAGVPTRQEMTDALASLVDPLLACWQPAIPPSAKPKPAAVEKCVAERVRARLQGYFAR